MFILALASLLSTALAQPPNWFPGGQCGTSKYSDAGDMYLPPGKIVGGQEARPNEFPWQVSVRRTSSNGHFCGGSIINEQWVLTAAHCMDGEVPSQVSLVVGDHTRSQPGSSVQTIQAGQIFVHEDYNSNTFENDVSLVKGASAISLNENVWPICAPDPSNLYTHQKAQCSGWGTLSSGGACCPDTLQYVTLNITTNQFCGDAYPDSIFDDMICATDNTGSTDRDSCQGDSGGPLSVKDGNGVFSLVGVVSWGIGCASGWPGVYARVGYQTGWITNIINNN